MSKLATHCWHVFATYLLTPTIYFWVWVAWEHFTDLKF
jgi:hypothetical protein